MIFPFRRRTRNVFLAGQDFQEPDRLRLDGVHKHAIETGRNRLIVMAVAFFSVFAAIGVRMVDISLFQGTEYSPRAPKMARTAELSMGRADIVDRNGILLATSLPTVAMHANPTEILDPGEAASQLVTVFPDMKKADLQSRLSMERSFVYLRRNLTPQQQYMVNALGIPGVYFEKSERRVYPQGSLVSHVVGLADMDGKGIAGIEKAFDTDLRAGPEPLRLSLDSRVQLVVHEELKKAVTEFKAIGGTAVVMNVHTGELLAMVSLPDFDPNLPVQTTSESMFNRATLGVYEMGSTFKLFNTAIALDSGKATPDSIYDASKPIKISRFTISDYHGKYRPQTVTEILTNSSNIGSAKMAMDFGTETQKAYFAKFGLLQPAAIELPEIGAPLVPHPWREINTMTISYGHGIAVTPLQMISGISALVNGGFYRQATLLKYQLGTELPAVSVIKTKTSQQVRRLMRLVVTQGSGKKADVAGYQIGGKTGTAEKTDGRKGYRRKALLSSFVATFPSNDPRYLILVMVDEPQGTKETYGFATAGWTAAPSVSRIASQIGPILGVPPVPDSQDPANPPNRGQVAQTPPPASSPRGARHVRE